MSYRKSQDPLVVVFHYKQNKQTKTPTKLIWELYHFPKLAGINGV